jgi:hypothetical protein
VVGGRIALRVGFGFDNPAAQTDPEELADDNFADEKAGEGDRICGEFGATEAADGNGGFASEAVRKSNLTPDLAVPARLA